MGKDEVTTQQQVKLYTIVQASLPTELSPGRLRQICRADPDIGVKMGRDWMLSLADIQTIIRSKRS